MSKRGVTLIELIIVIVIIGIGATLIAPGIGSWIQTYRLRGATRDIVSTMRTAQMKAVSINTEHRVSFDTAKNEYLLQIKTTHKPPNDWEPTWKYAREHRLQQTLPTGIGITVSATNFEFNPNSTATGGNVTLTVQRGGQDKRQKIIRVLAATGRIRIE